MVQRASSYLLEEERLQLLKAILRISNKSIYTSRIRYFKEGEGQGKGLKVEGPFIRGPV